MTTAAKTNLGAQFYMAISGQTPVLIGELLEVSPPKASRETLDVTTHDSTAGAMEFITSGVYDPGEIELKFNYIAGSAGDLAFLAAMAGATKQDFKIVLKAASGTKQLTGSLYVTEYGPDPVPVEGKQESTAKCKITGAVGQS